MTKKKSFIKRILSVLMVLTMCMSFVSVAYAADNDKQNTENVRSDIIATTSETIYGGSGSFDLYLSSGNWYADFAVAITGNSSGRYAIKMSHNGTDYNLGTVYGNGTLTDFYTLIYASPGTYTFTVTNVNASSITVTGVALVYD